MPSAQSIRDDLEDFRLNLASYSATFDSVVCRLDANLPPADVFAEGWTRCVQTQLLNDWGGGSLNSVRSGGGGDGGDGTLWMLTRTINVDRVAHRLCTSDQSNAPFIPRVVILGARGSGDQEQANNLAQKYGAIAIHFQDVLQKAVDMGDAVSRTIKSSLKTGAPIPDSVLHALVAKEISQLACQTQGWVMTGYPKTGEFHLLSAAFSCSVDQLFPKFGKLCTAGPPPIKILHNHSTPKTSRPYFVSHSLSGEVAGRCWARSKQSVLP